MVTTETPISSWSTSVPDTEAASAPPPLKRFELLRERLRGTVTILGDIVSPDPEMSVTDRD